MDAPATLALLSAAGLSVRLADGKLLLSPKALITDEHRKAVAACRAELVAELEGRANEAACERILARLPPGGYGRVAWLCAWE
jgi:hypothetical protein